MPRANANNVAQLPPDQQAIIDNIRNLMTSGNRDAGRQHSVAIQDAFNNHQIPLLMALLRFADRSFYNGSRGYTIALYRNIAAPAWSLPEIMRPILVGFIDFSADRSDVPELIRHFKEAFGLENREARTDPLLRMRINRAMAVIRDLFLSKYNNRIHIHIIEREFAVANNSNNSAAARQRRNNSNSNNSVAAHQRNRNSNSNSNNSAKNTRNNANRIYKINAENGANTNAELNAELNDEMPNSCENAGELSAKCENLLTNLDPIYKCFARKIAKICESVENPSDFQSGEKNLAKIVAHKADEFLEIHTADPEHPADSLVKAILDLDFKKLPCKLMKGVLSTISVQYKGKEQEGEGPGVARNFISDCITQLSTELLEPASSGSDYYAVKRALDLKDKNIKRKLITFGYLISLMIQNEISFPFKIQRALIHMMMFNTLPSQDPSYIAYQMIEDPESMLFAQTLLRKPDDIQHADLQFEDIGRKSKLVTKENFVSYLRSWVGYHCIPPGTKYVAKGFIQTGTADIFLSSLGNDVVTYIFNKLCVVSLDKTVLDKFLKNVTYTESVPADIKTWFSNILVGSDYKFFRDLLQFWSGLFTPMQRTYQVTMGKRVYSAEICSLPESHTCYLPLVLPTGLPNEEALKSILEKALGYVAKGVTMYGGRKQKKRTIHRRPHKNNPVLKNK